MFRRVFSSETLFIPHNVRRPFRRKKFQPLPFRQSRFPAKNSRLPPKPIPDESRANRQTDGKSPCYTLAEGSGSSRRNAVASLPDGTKAARRHTRRRIRHVFLRAAIGNGMCERIAVPGISDRHERVVALEQMGGRGHIHRAAGCSDRLRLAPYRGRGPGCRHLVPVGENLLVLSRSDLGLVDRLLPRLPEEVHRLHTAHHLRHQHP